MADSQDEIQIKIDLALKNADAASSLKEIKAQIKELKSAALELGQGNSGFQQLTERAAELQDQLNDVNDAVAIQGSGVQRLTTSFKLLADGIVDVNPDAFSQGLRSIGGVMKAIPILLLVEGITFLAEKFDLLGKIGAFVTQIINDFTDAIGLTAIAAEKASQSTIKAMQASEEAIVKRYEREISIANASSENTQKMEIEKLYAVENSTKLQIAVLEQLQAKKGELNDDELKQYKGLQDQLYKATSDRLTKEAKLVADFRKIVSDSEKTQTRIGLSEQEKEILDAQEKTQAKLKEFRDISFKQGVVDSEIEAKAYNAAEKTIIEEGEIEVAKIRKKYADASAKEIEEIRQRSLKRQYDAEKEGAEIIIKGNKEVDDRIAKEKKESDDAIIKQAEDFKKKNEDFDKDEAKTRLEENQNLSAAIKKIKYDEAKDAEEAEKKKQQAFKNTVAIIQQSLAAVSQIISGVAELQRVKTEEQLKSIDKEAESRLQNIQYQRDTDLVNFENTKNRELEILQANTQAQLDNENLSAEERSAINDNFQRQRNAIEQRAAKKTFDTQQEAAKSAYDIELKKYNTETEIKKKAFESDKKLRIAQAIITGASGALTAYASAQVFPPPAGPIIGAALAAAVGVLTAFQVAAIKKQTFDAGTPPAPPPPVATPNFGGNGADASSSTSQAKPTFALFGTAGTRNNQGTGSGDRAVNVNVNVGVSEVTSTQEKVAKYESASSLGG